MWAFLIIPILDTGVIFKVNHEENMGFETENICLFLL